MKLNVNKTRDIFFCRNTICHGFDYNLCESSITRTDYIRDLRVLIDAKFNFHQQVDNIFFHVYRMLGLIRIVTFPFSSLHNLLTLYYNLVRRKLEYVRVAWNSVTSTDAGKLERIQRKLVLLCHLSFSSYLDYSYGDILNYLQLHTLSVGPVAQSV
jgi:hypothetical protein